MNGNKIKNFKDLRIWQAGIEFVEEVYKITKVFPKEEVYGIVSQMRRSSISIPSNIAEGFMRHHNKEFKQFLFIALASSAEAETQLVISERLGYIPKSELTELLNKLEILNRMIMTLTKRL